MNFQNVSFVLSAASPADFRRDGLPQIVFAGKSNVGKSSVINRVLQRKNYARVGESPGKTVHINYFLVDGAAYLVDLPGYGYAKVPKAEKDRWARLMEDYFAAEGLITLGIMPRRRWTRSWPIGSCSPARRSWWWPISWIS